LSAGKAEPDFVVGDRTSVKKFPGLWRETAGQDSTGIHPLNSEWKWMDRLGSFHWLLRARARIPSYATQDTAGVLGVFLSRVVERIGEEQTPPTRVNLYFRPSQKRLALEVLWNRALKVRRNPPNHLFPEEDRVHGGDLGTIERSLDHEDYTGWYIALPVTYEGGEPELDASEASAAGPVEPKQHAAASPQATIDAIPNPKLLLINENADERTLIKERWSKCGFLVQTIDCPPNDDLTAFQKLEATIDRNDTCTICIDLVGSHDARPHFGARLAARVRAAEFRQQIVIISKAWPSDADWIHKDSGLRRELHYECAPNPVAREIDADTIRTLQSGSVLLSDDELAPAVACGKAILAGLLKDAAVSPDDEKLRRQLRLIANHDVTGWQFRIHQYLVSERRGFSAEIISQFLEQTIRELETAIRSVDAGMAKATLDVASHKLGTAVVADLRSLAAVLGQLSKVSMGTQEPASTITGREAGKRCIKILDQLVARVRAHTGG
jgi:hypothetical protein